VGAQTGVMLLDPNHPAEALRYADREITSPMGFNSVVSSGDMIWATHGEAGVVAWNAEQFDRPAFTIRPQSSSEGPRNAVALDDGRILYSAGGAVMSADFSGATSGVATSVATCIAITLDPTQILIIRADGSIEHLDRASLERITTTRHCGETTSATPLPWLGTTRLLLAT